MSGGFKLKTPDNAIFQHRQSRNVFYDAHALDQLLAHHDWVGLPSTGTPKVVKARIEALEDQSVRSLIGYLSQAANADSTRSLNPYVKMLAESVPDDFGQKLADELYSVPILSSRTNIVTGERIEIGKVGAGGQISYDDAADQLAGKKLPLTSGLRFLGLTKRLKFNMIKDVQVAVAIDQDALLKHNFGLMFSGAEVSRPVKIRGWSNAQLKITAGRDQSGGATFSFGLSGDF
jgi:hypothetical protein